MVVGDLIGVEVAYATPQEQLILNVDLVRGSTLRDAIQKSGILERFPEIDLARATVGIWGKARPEEHVLQPGDRVEIYRALIADPKEARRRRAQKA